MNRTVSMRRRPGAVAKMVAAALVAIALLAVSCTPSEPEPDPEVVRRRDERAEQTLRLVYPEWSSEIAGAHLIQAVLQERIGYRVELVPVPVDEMWSSVAEGQADILAGAWLPTTHRDYYRQYAPDLEDLGANLTGARIGLAVPTVTPGFRTTETGRTGAELVTITSISELAETADRFGGRVISIESGAGVVARTREALAAYGLDRRFRLVETDEAGMLARVSDAIRREEWIVFTGWTPHWVFERYSLRFLEDPQQLFGGEESIHTMVRRSLRDDAPDAHAVLSRMSWSPEDLERLMRWIQEGQADDPYGQALRWIRVNRDLVDTWVEGIE